MKSNENSITASLARCLMELHRSHRGLNENPFFQRLVVLARPVIIATSSTGKHLGAFRGERNDIVAYASTLDQFLIYLKDVEDNSVLVTPSMVEAAFYKKNRIAALEEELRILKGEI